MFHTIKFVGELLNVGAPMWKKLLRKNVKGSFKKVYKEMTHLPKVLLGNGNFFYNISSSNVNETRDSRDSRDQP